MVQEIRARLGRLTEVSHADAGIARQGRILTSLVLGLIAIGVVFLPLVWLLPDPGPTLLAVSVAIVLFLAIVRVLRGGRVLLGSVLILVTYLLALIVGVLASDRVGNGPQFVALAVTMAGATLGVRQVLVTLACALATLGLLYTVNLNAGGQTVQVSTLIMYAALMCILTAVVSAVTGSAVRRALTAEDGALLRSERLARELREANRTLEQRVADRTAELECALTNQTALASQLAELSLRDPLTGLHNRRHLDAEVVRMFEGSVRYERPICLALLDLDSFKTINDRFGHETGDEVLRRVARILVECTRAADLVVRYGGEELALVMPDTPMDAAVEVCERIREQIIAEPWDEVARGLTVTTSVGVSDGRGQNTVWHLFRAADRRLYAAKAAGRNRVIADAAGAA
jgi:diguanylate cyclase (GGDEF)-like protein